MHTFNMSFTKLKNKSSEAKPEKSECQKYKLEDSWDTSFVFPISI